MVGEVDIMTDIVDKILNDSYIENQWSEEKKNEIC